MVQQLCSVIQHQCDPCKNEKRHGKTYQGKRRRRDNVIQVYQYKRRNDGKKEKVEKEDHVEWDSNHTDVLRWICAVFVIFLPRGVRSIIPVCRR